MLSVLWYWGDKLDRRGGKMDDKQTLDPVDQFLNQILDEKKIAGSEDPEVRSQLIDDLRSRLMSQIDREMINALNAEQLEQLSNMLDKDDLTDAEIQDFFRQSGVNGQQVALETMMRFRTYYLGVNA